MQMQIKKLEFRLRAFAIVAGFVALSFAGWANADPPSRVARLGALAGPVSFSPAGESDWVQAAINRPLTTGDRLWAEAGARAEIQVGGAVIRMGDGTGLTILNLDDSIAQLQLTQGTLNVRVRRLESGQVFEVDTPNLAFTLRQPGEYRIEVDPDGNATTIIVRKGQGDVYGEGAAYVIDSRQPYRFTGTDLRQYQNVDAPRPDEFDRWSSDRDRSYDNSASARYVSQDVVGYQDLDANGTWRVDASYGNVWVPTRVAAGWAPYRDGHWAWVDPWGWTWVDDAPWGFAVSHYGRWANLDGTWGWVPGPVSSRAYYAPALVAFVGGSNFQIAISGGNVGGVAWFPLGPREVYRPSYVVSRGYFENVNRSNTVVNTTVINNYYNNTNVTNVVYVNRQVAGAVVAVPTTVFVQSQQVARAAVRVTPAMVASAPIALTPTVVPSEKSVHGAAAQGDRPPQRVFERAAVARTPPPAAAVGFAAQQQQLRASPGKPLDAAARKELKPAAAAPVPVVKVVALPQAVPPTARLPLAAPVAKAPDATGKPDERKAVALPPVTPGAPNAPARAAPPLPAAAPVTAPVPPPEQRGQGAASRPEQRAAPIVPPPARTADVPAPSPRAAEPKAFPQPAAPPMPAMQQPPQRVAPPPPPPSAPAPMPAIAPPRGAEPKAFPQPAAPPIPPMQQPPQRVAPPPVKFEPPPAARQVPIPPPVKSEPPPAARQVPIPPPVKSEPPPAARQAPTPPPLAAPKAPTPPPQVAPNAPPRAPEQKPAAGKKDEGKSSDEQKREEELRKQKGQPVPG